MNHPRVSYLTDCSNGALIANGHCNDETNNAECNFDGGDCCGSCINKNYCSNCTCIGNADWNGVSNAVVGDGVCNDETNNGECYYDGLDCCRSPVNTTLCSDCLCHGESIIFDAFTF